MDGKIEEKAREQAYFDAAAKHRQRHLDALAAAGQAAAHHRAAQQIATQLGAAGDHNSEAVAIGRIDIEGEARYIGRRLIRDDQGEPLVIGWQAPAAKPYYTASRDNPQGVARKRTYECAGNTILDFTDVRFAGPETADGFLLRELGRQRTGALRDIVATIQAAQYDVISQPPDQLLVIEGGPGTGKTVIALHRVSWLLHHHSELRAGGVLVVGPHPTFIRYIRDVLPSLGEAEVELRDIGQLAPAVTRGRAETPEVARLKGDERLARLLSAAVESRIGEPDPVERIPLGNRFLSVPGPDIAALITDSRQRPLPYAQRRTVFRDQLAALFADRSGQQVGPAALANLADRLWPPLTPAALLHDLLGSRARLAAAGGDRFTMDELALLYRRGSDRLSKEVWSEADLPLLDELQHLISGTEPRYAHIVVDEAQDLSPMQLRSLAHRSATGSLTVVGDIAQSTGAWARDSWDEVTGQLTTTCPIRLEALRYGYRVPRQAYSIARQLLAVAAPAVTPPEVVRDGPEPTVHQVELVRRADRVAEVAREHAERNRFVGIISPDRTRREVEAALGQVAFSNAQRGEFGAAINLVSPLEAKGLEFDAVVVVEPELIVAEHQRGHRMLYIALTRTTGYLDIVCAGDPLPLARSEA